MATDSNGHPPDVSRRVRDLFGRAIDLPPEQWPAFLDQECTEPRLRGEVERLLRRHNPTRDDFLESPAATLRVTAVDSWANSLVGSRIGQYTLSRLIATGGMGCVFEARQDHPARAVAVKVLPPGTSGRSALARFRLEPEMLGRLQHSNIAQVFESGVHDGELGPIPFFAMELIRDARSIVEFAVAAALDNRKRLSLFAKVCDAVHHGHQKGVIHRDLKPANILVDADGEPKVIDFGVARATDADVLLTTQQTRVGDLIGTIRYMSPEQCDGDSTRIDIRSDVYSLGVVLYELLTGESPYAKAATTIYAAVRMIKEDPPRRPGEISRFLRGDVEAIVLKALEKDPARRYGSAADLGRDIRRHLACEPIDARPPRAFTRALAWVRRRPLIASSLASILMLALAASGGGLMYWHMTAQPARIVVSADRSLAQLQTAIGYPLREWTTGRNGIPFAEFCERPSNLGGGPLAVLGLWLRVDTPYSGSVAVFDLRKGEEAPPERWRLTVDDIPTAEIIRHRGRDDIKLTPDDFGPTIGIFADVFDDPPGTNTRELVCVFQHGDYTQAALCVFRLDGRLLYRLWIDADIDGMLWVAGARVLVLHGVNGEALTTQREVVNPTPTVPHARVIFGIRPRLGLLLSQYLVQEPSEREGVPEELLPHWYYCMLPLTDDHPQSRTESDRLYFPEGWGDGENVVQVNLRTPPIGTAIPVGMGDANKSWCLDAETGRVTRTYPINEFYRDHERTASNPKGYFPPYDSWYLGELPPKKKRPAASAPASAPAP